MENPTQHRSAVKTGYGVLIMEDVMNSKLTAPLLRFLMIAFMAAFILIPSHMVEGFPQQQRSAERDRQTLMDLENEWLNANDAKTLDRILASEFVHPVPTGDFLTKAQHIQWFTRHPRPANIKARFERLDIRIYGDIGIANGMVITSDENGKEIGRNVFTDIFVYRDGQWQAINAQETDVQK
jgi:hypothetical protein